MTDLKCMVMELPDMKDLVLNMTKPFDWEATKGVSKTLDPNSPYYNIESLLPKDWFGLLKDQFQKPYWRELVQNLNDVAGPNILPEKHMIFRAFQECPVAQVKVVLLGQDPYFSKGQAEGLSFSVPKGVAVPSSLQNIFKELADDLKVPCAKHGHLLKWAKQGILLLNSTLTVTEKQPNSHAQFGWQSFTDTVLQQLCKVKKDKPIVFMLWGAFAQKKASKISGRHLVLKAAHPSGRSADQGFFGCKHFSQCNSFLQRTGQQPIDWSLD